MAVSKKSLKHLKQGDLILVEGVDWTTDCDWRGYKEAESLGTVRIIQPGFFVAVNDGCLSWAGTIVDYEKSTPMLKYTHTMDLGAIARVKKLR